MLRTPRKRDKRVRVNAVFGPRVLKKARRPESRGTNKRGYMHKKKKKRKRKNGSRVYERGYLSANIVAWRIIHKAAETYATCI